MSKDTMEDVGSIHTSRVDIIVVCLGIVFVEDVRGNIGGVSGVMRVDHVVVVQSGGTRDLSND